MSFLRSLVASTSTSSSSSSSSASSSLIRALTTAAPDVVPPIPCTSRTQLKSQSSKWTAGLNRAVRARLPPVVVQRVETPKSICPPRAPLETPQKFVDAIGRGISKKLQGKVDLETMLWEDLMTWRPGQWLEKGGLEVKDRRYLLWQIKMFKKGWDPRRLAMELKKPKKYRAWGDAVQDGLRIPGARFKMDLTHARRPFGLPGFPFRGFKRE